MKATGHRLGFTCVALTLSTLGVVRAGPSPSAMLAEFESALADFDQAQQIQPERPGRARQLFRSAAQHFESIIAAGVVNGSLEYNLANCHLQAGDVGQAVLHYRRAQGLSPRDPLLQDNLTEARSRCLTSILPTRRSAVLRSVFFWHYDTSTWERGLAAVVLYVAFWILLTVRGLVRNRGVAIAAVACAAITVALAGSVAADAWVDRHAPPGVVTAMDVVVSKGPGASYQRQFAQPLQPGVEFTLRSSRGDWWNIELADGNTGWIERGAAELITPPVEHLILKPG